MSDHAIIRNRASVVMILGLILMSMSKYQRQGRVTVLIKELKVCIGVKSQAKSALEQALKVYGAKL